MQRYLYDQDGAADARKPDWNSYTSSDTPTNYDWRYLWHGSYQVTIDAGGLYYQGGRWYDPQSGRPIQPDLSAYSAGLNAYHSSGLNWWDRSIIAAAPWVAGAAGFAVGGPAGAAIAFAGVSGFEHRFEAGQSGLQSFGGAYLDAFGVSGVGGALFDRDVVMGERLNWSTGQRWFYGVSGALQVAGLTTLAFPDMVANAVRLGDEGAQGLLNIFRGPPPAAAMAVANGGLLIRAGAYGGEGALAAVRGWGVHWLDMVVWEPRSTRFTKPARRVIRPARVPVLPTPPA